MVAGVALQVVEITSTVDDGGSVLVDNLGGSHLPNIWRRLKTVTETDLTRIRPGCGCDDYVDNEQRFLCTGSSFCKNQLKNGHNLISEENWREPSTYT
jgi:acyl CoA:acetate/3-ketoacid CoA transferase alpha subunit